MPRKVLNEEQETDAVHNIRATAWRGMTGHRHACYIKLQLSIPAKTQPVKSAGSNCLVRQLTVNPGFHINMTQVLLLYQVGCRPRGITPLKGSLVFVGALETHVSDESERERESTRVEGRTSSKLQRWRRRLHPLTGRKHRRKTESLPQRLSK